MEWLYVYGIELIIFLQKFAVFTRPPYTLFWIYATRLGDPRTIFTLHAPFLFVFLNESPARLIRSDIFVRFFAAGAISEFLNAVFKWALLSDRPYWWIHTSGHGRDRELLKLHQFPPTCETGPGSPSGHCMVTAAAWIVIILSRRSKFSRNICIAIYAVFLTVLAVSRLSIATHFPHQVLFGAVVGMLVGYACYEFNPSRISLAFTLKLIGSLITSALITYKGLHALGLDPDWSIALAFKYCEDPSWIHLSTTPFGGLFRDCGALIGLGLAAELAPDDLDRKYRGVSFGRKCLGFALSLMLVQVINYFPIDWIIGRHIYWFYLCVFLEHALLVLGYTVAIPRWIRGRIGTDKDS